MQGADSVIKKLGSAYELVGNTVFNITNGDINSEIVTIPTLGMNIHIVRAGHYSGIIYTFTVYGVKNNQLTNLGAWQENKDIICADYDYIQVTFSGTVFYMSYNYFESI